MPNIFFCERAINVTSLSSINQPAMLVGGNLGFVVRRIEIDFLLSGLGTVLEVESSL